MIAAGPGEFGGSEWTQVTQHEVDRLADLTGDHQWIHFDAERARLSTFGSTICTWQASSSWKTASSRPAPPT
jgi:acyl dehydratase